MNIYLYKHWDTGALFFVNFHIALKYGTPPLIEAKKWNANSSCFLQKKRPHALLSAFQSPTVGPMPRWHAKSASFVSKRDLYCTCTSEPSFCTSTMYATSSSTKVTVCVKFRHHRCNWLFILAYQQTISK